MTKKKLRLMTKKLGIFSYFFHYLGICFYVVSISRYSTHSKEWLKFSIKEHRSECGAVRLSSLLDRVRTDKASLGLCGIMYRLYKSAVLYKISICPYMAKNHSSTVLNSPKLETTHMPIKSRIKKKIECIYTTEFYMPIIWTKFYYMH